MILVCGNVFFIVLMKVHRRVLLLTVGRRGSRAGRRRVLYLVIMIT